MINLFLESDKSSKEFIEDAVTSASVSMEHSGQFPDRPLEKNEEDAIEEAINPKDLFGEPLAELTATDDYIELHFLEAYTYGGRWTKDDTDVLPFYSKQQLLKFLADFKKMKIAKLPHTIFNGNQLESVIDYFKIYK